MGELTNPSVMLLKGPQSITIRERVIQAASVPMCVPLHVWCVLCVHGAAVNSLSHVGSASLQEPSSRQVLDCTPLSLYPRVQVYTAM